MLRSAIAPQPGNGSFNDNTNGALNMQKSNDANALTHFDARLKRYELVRNFRANMARIGTLGAWVYIALAVFGSAMQSAAYARMDAGESCLSVTGLLDIGIHPGFAVAMVIPSALWLFLLWIEKRSAID